MHLILSSRIVDTIWKKKLAIGDPFFVGCGEVVKFSKKAITSNNSSSSKTKMLMDYILLKLVFEKRNKNKNGVGTCTGLIILVLTAHGATVLTLMLSFAHS